MDFVMTSTTTESVAGTVETAAVQTESQTSLNTANNANVLIHLMYKRNAQDSARTQNIRAMDSVMMETTTVDVHTMEEIAAENLEKQSSTNTVSYAFVEIQSTEQSQK
jgi:hypothetical protein